MAKTLEEKIRITYIAVAVKNPGYVWGKKNWSFSAHANYANKFFDFGGNTKFPVKKKHAFDLPKKSFSIEIDVTGQRSVNIGFEATLHALGTKIGMGKVEHTLRAPFKQIFGRIDTVKNLLGVDECRTAGPRPQRRTQSQRVLRVQRYTRRQDHDDRQRCTGRALD